jgi:glycosyltransferase involved in cell wall biosynthesis
MNRRLLIASYSYPPIADVGSFRTIKLAKYLVRMGWAVHVVSVRNPDVWRIIGPAEEPPGVEVTRTLDPIRLDRAGQAIRSVIMSRGSPGLSAKAGLGRRGVVVPEFQAGWLLTASGAMARIARRWQATHLMGTGPPFSSLIAAAVAARKTGLPFLADLQDSWTIHPDTRYPTGVLRAIDEALERTVFRQARAITVVTRTIADRYGRRYPQWKSKIHVLPNGYDPEDLPRASEPREGPFTIAYTGSFYPHSPPTTLLAALQRLVSSGAVPRDGLRVEFVGRPEETIRKDIETRGLADVVIVQGFRPLREAAATAARADLLYLLIPRHFREALSDKIFLYLATGNPILAEVPEGEAREFLKERGGEVSFVPPGDVSAMESAIREAFSRGRSRTSASPRLEEYRVAFSRERQAQQLAQLLEALT